MTTGHWPVPTRVLAVYLSGEGEMVASDDGRARMSGRVRTPVAGVPAQIECTELWHAMGQNGASAALPALPGPAP